LNDTTPEATAMNVVRHKKSGVVVVVPGSAKTLEAYDEAHKGDIELVESEIK